MTKYPGLRRVSRGDGGVETASADVCVVGSGAAGLSAALEARALGRSVVLVDAAPSVGGQAVGSVIGTICGLYGNGPAPVRVTHGAIDGLLHELIDKGAARAMHARNTVILDYDINHWQRWAERELVARDIAPLFGAVVRQVTRSGNRVTALELATRWGDQRVEAEAFIDASGDAVVAWFAGLELNQADQDIYGTVMAVFEGVNTRICAGYPRARYHEAMRRRGEEFGLVRFDGFVFPVSGEGRVLLNQTHIETPQNAIGLARAGIEGRRQIDALLALFREEFPEAFGNARVAVYGQPGIRQTRSIRGRTSLNVADVRAGARPSDTVARCSWPIELHTKADDTSWEIFADDHMHFIPFGAMTPTGLDNVVVAGRCIDAEPAALASVRVMGPCFAMGRAAAAAVTLAGSGSVHQLDVAALQAALADNLDGGTRDPWLADAVNKPAGPAAAAS